MQKAKKLEATEPQQLIKIIFPEAGKLRARKVVTRSRARATGKFPSRKMNRMLQWESVNELNAFRLLEAAPGVKSYQEQPCEIQYTLNGESFVHYPDILVNLTHHREFWEIKPMAKAEQPETAARTKFLSSVLPDFGYQYRVVLGEQLGKKIRLYNIKRLLSDGASTVSTLLREQVRQVFSQTPEISMEHLLMATGGELSKKHIYRLILDGDLWCDLECEIGTSSLLRICEDGGKR